MGTSVKYQGPYNRSNDFEQIVSAGFDGDVVAGPVSVDFLTHGEGVLRILLCPGLNLKIIHTLEILNPTPTNTHPKNRINQSLF